MQPQPVNRKFRPETLFWPWPALPVVSLVLLVGSFLYVWLRVEPLLEYHACGPFFFRQRAFLETFFGRPGGLANYAGVFLAQLNYQNWLGALVFVLSECLAFLTALFCLARISGKAPGFVALIPPFVLLLLRNRYGCPVPAISIGLILALTAFAVLASLPWRRAWLLTIASGLVSGILFYLAGLWCGLHFAALCGLFASLRMLNRLAGLACLALGLAAPLLTIQAGNLEVAELINPWSKGVPWVLAAALYASVPVAAGILALLPPGAPAALPASLGTSEPGGEEGARKGAGKGAGAPGRGRALVVLAILLGGATVWLTFDMRQKRLAAIDYYAASGQYERVLAAARQVKALTHPAKIRLQLALYHTGRLAEELFSFHNMVEESPFESAGEDCRAQSQPLLELGLVNDAEHMAYEALVMEGERPDVLRLLARIHRLKDQPQAAQVFLNVLSLIPFQGEQANNLWPTMIPEMPVAESASLASMRARALTNDVLHEGLPMARLLDVLLASNPANQMAFEYAMAGYLSGLDLKKAVEHLRFLDNFSYARLPRSYEEALLLYQQLAGVQVELKGRAIRPETADRFRQFNEALAQFKGTSENQAALAANFGDTYWYYYAARSRERAGEGQAAVP